MALAQGRHLDGVVGDERGLHELLLAVLAEDGVDELALAHRGVGLDAEACAGFAQLLLGLARDVVAGLLADGVGHGDAAERRLERDCAAVDGDLRRTVGRHRNPFEHALREVHHPAVVLVGHVDLHARELGVVRAVHALVAEVLAEFVHAVEAAHDQLLEVELRGDAQVEVGVERVVVRDERARRRAARYGLQDGRLHLDVALLVEEGAHGGHDAGALYEDLLDVGVHHQIDVTLAVTHLGVGEGVERLAVLLLDHGQRTHRLRNDGQFAAVHRQLARVGAEREALHAHEVADVEQLLEDGVVQRRIALGADVVAADVDLYAARVVLEFEKRDAAHDAARHDAARQAHRVEVALVGVVAFGDFARRGRHVVPFGRIGVDAQVPEGPERLPAQLLLFAEFDCHYVRILYLSVLCAKVVKKERNRNISSAVRRAGKCRAGCRRGRAAKRGRRGPKLSGGRTRGRGRRPRRRSAHRWRRRAAGPRGSAWPGRCASSRSAAWLRS